MTPVRSFLRPLTLSTTLVSAAALLALGCSAGDGGGTGGTGNDSDPLNKDTGTSSGTSTGDLVIDKEEPNDTPGQGEETCVVIDGVEQCYCLRVAVIGTADSAANDSNASAFRDWLNTKSNALVTVLDPKDPVDPQPKPTLSAEFLNNYDVLILQLQGDSKDGPFWTYTTEEITSLRAWVEAGGGIISLTGYNGNRKVEETAASNALLLPVAGMEYQAQDVLLGNTVDNSYCWGGSTPVTDWSDDTIGYELTAVGAYNGYPISGGTAVATAGAHTVGAVAEVGEGHVFAWADEWVLFTSQWKSDPGAQPYDNEYDPCYQKPAENVYQVPQFWYNALTYAGGNRVCLEINEPTIVVK